jgi:nicotinate phosphoribosyltransferase
VTPALLTDLYQITMAAGYFEAGKTGEQATFELYVRRLPPNRNFLLACGLSEAAEYLLNLHFTPEEIAYLRSLPQFAGVGPGFFETLARFRFTGNLHAVPEGTPVFAGEPILRVHAPLMEAQIPETALLSLVGFQTMIATKAARIVEAAGRATVVEFGTRRAHSPEAGVLAGRAAYIGGCVGTSNTLTGFRYGIPVFGTAAHSWIMSFPSELEAFRHLQRLLGPSTVYLIDSYDTLEGARNAASLGRPVWGVRLDSGNLVELSRAVRRILDDAGLPDAKIMGTGDLNEYKIVEHTAAAVPLDSYGVGTELATSADSPSVGAIYKLVELESEGRRRFTAKYSEDKRTLPGAKQVFRCPDHDTIACEWEQPPPNAELLLHPVIRGGELVTSLPSAAQAREHAAASLRRLPRALHSLYPTEFTWPVHYSPELVKLEEKVWRSVNGAV